ncbi:MAG: hypothetical protein KH354_04955 [Clostridiales bacterium]|nr:hypothetical protein [Clostridiales bacterium]
MNRNPKEKLARIDIRVKPKDKDKIKRIAKNVIYPSANMLCKGHWVTNREQFNPMPFLISTTSYANCVTQQNSHPKQAGRAGGIYLFHIVIAV